MTEEIQQLSKVMDTASEFIVNYGFQLLGAIIILVLGWVVARWAHQLTMKLCQKTGLDITLSQFFAAVAKSLVIIFVVIIVLGNVGITITPFIAALGAVAFGGTLALQGPLSNYGGGLMIIMTRPFVVGDTITIHGVTGIVDDIKLTYTFLSTEDDESIIIPNKQIVGEIISNTRSNLLVETTIRISYNHDPQIAISIIDDILKNHTDVTDDPLPLVGIRNFAESTYEIGVRYWLPTRRYYELLYDVNTRIQQRLQSEGIDLALPGLNVHVQNNGA